MIAEAGQLKDRPRCGHPLHSLLAWEREAITDLFESWSGINGSHRKLAHPARLLVTDAGGEFGGRLLPRL
jgi:hypothetical protein